MTASTYYKSLAYSSGRSWISIGESNVVVDDSGLISWFSIASPSITDDALMTLGLATYAVRMLRTAMPAIRVQVVFSRISVVLRTPIIWFDEAKPAARPPPFEFWIVTMKQRNTARITIMTSKTLNIFIFIFDLSRLISPNTGFGPQSKCFYSENSNKGTE